MPLAGGRGVQDSLNGDQDSIAQRVTSVYKSDRPEVLYVCPFPLTTASLTYVDAGSYVNTGFTSIFTLAPISQLTGPITVARICTRVGSGYTGTGVSILYTKLYTFEEDIGMFKSVDESFNTTLFGPSSMSITNTYFHTVLPDNRKFQLDPSKKYFSGVFTSGSNWAAANGNPYAMWSGGVDPIHSILASTILTTMPKSINLSDLTVGTIIGAPNIIYTNQKAKDIFKWQ